MLLAGWDATIGTSAYLTSTVSDIIGSEPRSFREWVTANADAFTEGTAMSAG